jgi:FkbM family methyltransferase
VSMTSWLDQARFMQAPLSTWPWLVPHPIDMATSLAGQAGEPFFQTKVVETMFEGWKPRDGTTDQRIIDHVYMENGYEMPDDLSGKHVIDIGANIGTFSRLCAERCATVIAFEPYWDSYALLCEHVAGLSVTPMWLGLGPKNGTARLYIHDSNMGGHSITEKVGSGFVTIETVTLDHILMATRCDILKLDCEGAEVFAFPPLIAGLHSRVPEIVMEFHDERSIQQAQRDALAPYYHAHNIFQADWRLTHV